MLSILENMLEALYVYQVSPYYKLHLVVVVLGILGILWLFLQEFRIRARDSHPVETKCSERVDYFNYVISKQKNTEEAVLKLQQSEEYQRYLMEKNNPNSKYNRREEEDDDDEIVLSDDSDVENGKNRKFE